MARLKKLPKFVKLRKPEKQVKNLFDLKAFAEVAAKGAAEKNELGAYLEVIDEGEGISTYLFEAKKLGYQGWRWSVTIFQADPLTEPSLCEVVMVPGEDSLVAPKWVPWSERLADYQALQLELERQAFIDAANAIDEEEAAKAAALESDVVEDSELAVADFEPSEDAKN
jgi:hypothetical protein